MAHERHGRDRVTSTTPVPPLTRVTWAAATRVIASRFPPIDLYERVSSDRAVSDALIQAEMLVNPRLRDEIGDIHLVPPEDRVSGPGASFVMAPFTHVNPRGSRFSDGSYGVYYAADRLETAVAETAFHFAQYAADSQDPPRRETMRVLVGTVDANLHDIVQLDAANRALLLDPVSYGRSRPFAVELRDARSDGLHYPSVRDAGGRCIAAFRPTVVGIPKQTTHLLYDWDGTRVRRYFNFDDNNWVPLAA
jgi:hypothetical protein